MKSFWYSIPPDYMPMHPYEGETRIRVFYEGNEMKLIQLPPDLLLMGWNQFEVWRDCQKEVDELYQQSLAKVDITPTDSCPHDEVAQDIQ